MTPDRRIEPALHWWEASALTTKPSFALSKMNFNVLFTSSINSMIVIHEGIINFVLHFKNHPTDNFAETIVKNAS